MTAPADLASLPVESLWPEPRTRRQARAYNRLRGDLIDTIAQLVNHPARDLLNIRNFGVASLEEVRSALAARGLCLPGDEPPGALDATGGQS
jgi:DNA-directed RNA polymerase alpha subunit